MHNELLLGKTTEYKSTYDASLLFPIARQDNRSRLPGDAIVSYGVDIWNAYEISWLNLKGVPQVAVGIFTVPAESTNIIESKSFKLYLNSFNQSHYASVNELVEIMVRDLSVAADARVGVELKSMQDSMPVEQLRGDCIDDLDITVDEYQPNANLLSIASTNVVEKTLVSHLLKSNCPVTNQPDWGSIQIDYKGAEISEESLLAYIVSYREHSDFHEHCVESIFADITQRCKPESLTVYARYTRRGGLDINPLRSSSVDVKATNPRLIRQ
jgi:7-cyano-7-deazaguanine reductase